MKTETRKKPRKLRPYRQTARAHAAEAREMEILAVFQDLLLRRALDAVTLTAVAEGAGVTQQTVIRKLGGKEGLLRALANKIKNEVVERRQVVPGDVGGAIAVLVHDYESIGDLIMRLLMQEGRDPALSDLLQLGRREHRQWVATAFAPALSIRRESERGILLDALVAATDLYVWKLLRRDFGYAPAHVARVMDSLVVGLLRNEPSLVISSSSGRTTS